MENLKGLIERLKAPGVLVTLIGLVGLLLTLFGLDIDMVWLEKVALTICSILIIIGGFNNPDTPGINFLPVKPFEKDPFEGKDKKEKDNE